MAADAPAKSGLGFLGQKVGPLPLGVWLVAGGGIYWYLSRNKSASTAGAANQQTDPAGNIGSIDPATGYVYGTPEDTAALAANNAGTGTGTTPPSGTTAQTYPDNATWGRAAVNYLVGIGIDPTEANQAISLYLASQSLTTQYQGDVNLAIQALGAPPSLPGPTGNNPGGVVTPPGTGGPGGGQAATVPNVIGQPAGEAFNVIKAAGLTPAEASPSIKPTWTVTSQSPKAGTKVNPGSKVSYQAKAGGGGGKPPVKPLAPKNLHVTGNNATAAQVSWDLPGGVKNASWLVQNHLGGSTGPVVDNFSTNNTIANLGGALAKPKPGLVKGKKYTVRIRENVSGAPWGSVSFTAK